MLSVKYCLHWWGLHRGGAAYQPARGRLHALGEQTRSHLLPSSHEVGSSVDGRAGSDGIVASLIPLLQPARLAPVLWAVAERSWVWPEAFDSLCGAAAAKVQDFNAQDRASSLWAMAATSRVLPEVFDSLCGAAAAKVQDFNAQDRASTLWAMAAVASKRKRSPTCFGPWPR